MKIAKTRLASQYVHQQPTTDNRQLTSDNGFLGGISRRVGRVWQTTAEKAKGLSPGAGGRG
jgi:hypothetical protein